MKYDKLKRQVGVELGIMGGVLLVMAALIYVLISVLEDYETGNQGIQKQVDAIDLEMNTLRGRFSNIKNNIDIYEEISKKKAEGRLAINRQMALEKFNQFKTRYTLSSMRMTVSNAQEVKDGIFKRKNSNVNFSDVVVSFEVMSDENIFQLVDSLREELPGISKVVRMNMYRQRPFDDEVYRQVAQKGTYPLIKSEIRFIWFGINSTEPPAASSPATPTAPNAPPG
jgi:hypothetical protein